MFVHPDMSPIAFSLGPLKVHWYGLMYLISFLGVWVLLGYRAKRTQGEWTTQHVADVLFYGAMGVVLGGRLGYVFFYGFHYYFSHPLSIFKVWDGGMSFHGGVLGVLMAMGLFAWRFKKSFFAVTDFIAPAVPLGLGAGRIGNFINAELWGRVTDVPWAMVYPHVDNLPRHPSEIYEFLLEGVLLFTILWWYSAKPKPRMAVSGLFMLGYGSLRFFAEFFRQPDAQIGFVVGNWMTMGQVLSVPMIIVGVVLWVMSVFKVPSPRRDSA